MGPLSGLHGMIEHPVHQPRHRTHAAAMTGAVMPILNRQRLITPQPTDPMLHDDPPTRERLVVTPIRRRPLLATRLLPRCRTQALRVQRRYPLVGRIPDPAHAL